MRADNIIASKFIGLVLLGLLSGCQFLWAPANQLQLRSASGRTHFEWTAEHFGQRWEPHSSMIVPVTLNGIPRTFYMQFDLGVRNTVLYRRTVEAIATRYPQPFSTYLSGDRQRIEQITLQTGELTLHLNAATVLEKMGTSEIDWETSTPVMLGSIGADLLDERVIIIDYPLQQLAVFSTVPESIAQQPFGALHFRARRIYLDVLLNNESCNLMFDTGSSAFTLLTDENTWQQWRKPQAQVDSFNVRSWDKQLTAHIAPTDVTIQFGATVLPLSEVSYIEGSSGWSYWLMRLSGMGGMTGNKLFVAHRLVLDAKRERYWLLPSEKNTVVN